ncbi:hypothetical protein EYF80_009882 [Liparis tanakae]|uniref:Uncharacterized protein n=1 Tax=Liparis tanakae TaxID=230148 RepID=A0A4Z2IPM7_9TELE|nr:hypothetical protein EYF80_009882 [Liparis tanakae]
MWERCKNNINNNNNSTTREIAKHFITSILLGHSEFNTTTSMLTLLKLSTYARHSAQQLPAGLPQSQTSLIRLYGGEEPAGFLIIKTNRPPVLPLRNSLLALPVGGMEGPAGMCRPHSSSGPQPHDGQGPPTEVPSSSESHTKLPRAVVSQATHNNERH